MNEFGKLFRIYPKLKSFFYIYYNRLWFSLIGIKYGMRMIIANKIYVKGKGKVVIGDDFLFTSGDCINPVCRNLRGVLYTENQDSMIRIGNNTGISGSCLWAKEYIEIGNNVNIGGNCLIIDNDAHSLDFMERRRLPQIRIKKCNNNKIFTSPIEIEDDVWIGMNCIVLKGVKIGARSIIGAGSIVTKSVPSDVVAAGNPCRVIKVLSGENKKV